MKLFRVKFVDWDCEDYVVAESVAEIEEVAKEKRDRSCYREVKVEKCELIAGTDSLGLDDLIMREGK